MKDFWELWWGDSWTGYESMGRWLTVGIAVLFLIIAVAIWASARSDRRFVQSCYDRGGHVHYKYRTVAGPGIIVGNVVVPTNSVACTMTFAPGKKENCQRCPS